MLQTMAQLSGVKSQYRHAAAENEARLLRAISSMS